MSETYPHLRKPPEGESEWFEALIALARYLRRPEGCPWDREQGAADFARYLTDEVEELVEALNSGDNRHAGEEFGDVFFTLLATAAAAEEEGRFRLEEALEHRRLLWPFLRCGRRPPAFGGRRCRWR